MVVEIRRAIPADASAIRTLTRAAYAKWVPVIGREPKPMVADYAEAVRKHLIYLLCVGAELAALVETIPKTNHLLIENVAVLPPFQGGGFCRELVAFPLELWGSLWYRESGLYTNKLFCEDPRLSLKPREPVGHAGAFSRGP